MRWKRVLLAAPTSGDGTQNPNVSGSEVPIGVIALATSAVADGEIVQGSILGIGAWDGTTAKASSTVDQNASGSVSDTGGRSDTGALLNLCLPTGTGIDARLTPTTFEAGGAEVEWSNLPATALLIEYWFAFADFPGEAFTVVEFTTHATQDSSISISGLPASDHKAIFAFTGLLGTGGGAETTWNNLRIMLGFACDAAGGTRQQTSISIYAQDAVTPTEVIGAITASYLGFVVSAAGFAAAYEATNIDSTSIQITTRVGSIGTRFFGVVISSPLRAWCGNASSVTDSGGAPIALTTTTGERNINNPGFPIDTVFGIGTAFTALDILSTTFNAGLVSFGIASSRGGSATQGYAAFQTEDASTLADTRSVLGGSRFIQVVNNGGTFDWECDFTSHQPLGFKIQITDPAPGRLGLFLGWEAKVIGTAALKAASVALDSTGALTAAGSAQIRSAAADINSTGTLRVPGSSQIRAAAADINSAGALTAPGSAALKAVAPAVDATGSLNAPGTCTIRAVATAIDAGGLLTLVGSSDIAASTAALLVDGDVELTGSAAIASVAPAIDAAGAPQAAGTAQIRAVPAALDAAGNLEAAGSAQLRAASAALDVAGDLEVVASVQLRAVAPAIDVSGDVLLTGSAQLRAASPSFTSAGALAALGSADLAVEAPSFDAVGNTAQNEVFGTATLAAPASSIDSSGAITVVGSAAVRVAAPSIDASGTLTIAGSAALRALAPTIASAGALAVVGSAELLVEAPSFDAAGTAEQNEVVGTVALRVGAPWINTTGTIATAGSAALRVASPTLDASSTLETAGTAELRVRAPSIKAFESRTALPGSYVLRVALPGSYGVEVDLLGSYDARAALAGARSLRVALPGSRDVRIALPGEYGA